MLGLPFLSSEDVGEYFLFNWQAFKSHQLLCYLVSTDIDESSLFPPYIFKELLVNHITLNLMLLFIQYPS